MKSGTYLPKGQERPRVGALRVFENAEYLVDVTRAYAHELRELDHNPRADEIAAARVPTEMIRLLEAGSVALDAARRGVEFVAQAVLSTGKAQALVDSGILHHRSAVN